MNRNELVTEGINPETSDIDTLSTVDIIKRINHEDKKVALAVEKEIANIAKAVDIIFSALSGGGRLFYVGAGTSGRLGILDASECPPTFSTPPDMVQGIIAGGNEAVFKAVEGAEDDGDLGRKDLMLRNLRPCDVVVGIAASGRTPYVIGALEYAAEVGAERISITCNPDAPLNSLASVSICPVVGPEVISGSTRMKAGTAQKMVLNMLSTAAMIKLGKVYKNLMVDVNPTNKKLMKRACNIVKLATGADENKIKAVLDETGYSVKQSIMMLKTGLSKDKAEKILKENKGYLRKALEFLERES